MQVKPTEDLRLKSTAKAGPFRTCLHFQKIHLTYFLHGTILTESLPESVCHPWSYVSNAFSVTTFKGSIFSVEMADQVYQPVSVNILSVGVAES